MTNDLYDDLTPDLAEFDPKGSALAKAWYTAEEAKSSEDKEEVERYYLNETRIWRSIRLILRQRYTQMDKRIPLDAVNYKVRVGYDEGYRQALRDFYRLIPRPRENRNE